jgi:nicotinate-nucleotide pyrophosphorylase (carboxylating)
MSFNAAEADACRQLIALAMNEDLGPESRRADPTTTSLIPPGKEGKATFVARNAGIVAGIPAVELVLAEADPRLVYVPRLRDGTKVEAGDILGGVSGPLAAILMAERIGLNFMQRMSGVATLTRRYVDAVAGLNCQIFDTRKTIPGWRLMDKYAVRCGGGHNHRMGLYDLILIKDNHLAAWSPPLSPARAVQLARQNAGQLPIEIEVDTLTQLDEALRLKPEFILLDNMPLEQLREAVRRRNQVAPAVVLEASGGVTLANVRAIAETGVDRISVGALTHSATALDIALDFLPPGVDSAR